MKRKVLSLLLVLALCVGLAIPALAAETKIIEQYGNPAVEVTNVVSEGSYLDPKGSGSPLVVLYTTAPTTVTLLTKVEDCDVGGLVAKASRDNAGAFSYNVNETIPLATGEYIYESEDKMFYSIDAGATYVLEEGIYFFHSVEYSKGFYVVVEATTVTPAPETPSSWAVEYVNTAIAAGLVPDALQSKYTTATTRAEFCALAVALYENVTGKTITDRKTFDDTKDVNVEKAAAIGVVSGVGNNMFSPDTKLTREQAATMLSRLADAIGKPLTKQAATFADTASVSTWAAEAVGQMQATGIMTGVGANTFSPKTDYTREQSIITIMRLFDIVK